MMPAKVADLTIDQFRELIRETVTQTLSDMMGDPDEGMELREDFTEELRHSLSVMEAMEAGGKTVAAQKVAERLGLSW